MIYCKETPEKLIIFSIPATTVILTAGNLVLQIVVIVFFYGEFRDGSFGDFLGYGWLNKSLKLFLLFLPVLFAVLCYILMPFFKTAINRRGKIVSVKKILPFVYAKKFGFDFIKDARVEEKNADTRSDNLLVELDSGEKINLFAESSGSREKFTEIAGKINSLLKD
jgi:energy-coupling factor transporter transmembrane protein EcfT